MSDDYLWLENTATKIKLGLFNEIDSDRLIEEIEDMGASQKRSLESYLEKLIEHLLKLKYWESEYERNHRHWKAEIINFRNRILRILKNSPSLKNYFNEIYDEVFEEAVEVCHALFRLINPEKIPQEKILDKGFLGDS
jgi:hypothetical protein